VRQKTPEIHAKTEPVLRILRQKTPEIPANTEPVTRILISNQK
jgi:hypothetical protein